MLIGKNSMIISQNLVHYYARLNILRKPMQIYNINESGVTVVPGKVISEIVRRCVWSLSLAEKGKTHTIITCV